MRKIEVAASPHERSSAQTTSSSRLAYGIDGAADALDISRSRIYELIAAGEIAACKVGKRTIIPTTELAAFLDRHRVARWPDVRPGLAPRTSPAQSRQRGKSEPETE